MNIIFGKEQAELLKDKYTLLELDTFVYGGGDPTTAYCVADSIPLESIPQIQEHLTLHQELIENYKNKNWEFCTLAINKLENFWGGDVNTFYENLRTRVAEYSATTLDDSWTGFIYK